MAIRVLFRARMKGLAASNSASLSLRAQSVRCPNPTGSRVGPSTARPSRILGTRVNRAELLRLV